MDGPLPLVLLVASLLFAAVVLVYVVLDRTPDWGLLGGLGTGDVALSASLLVGLVLVLALADSRLLHATGLRQVVVLDSAVTDERDLVARLEMLLDARVTRVTPIRVDLVDDTTTVEVHYASAPRPSVPAAERHDVAAVTR